MKFLIDMPLSPALAQWLMSQDHDAVHASAANLHRADDTEVIERARAEDRIIVTADLDYPRILSHLQSDKPALILFRGGNYSESKMLELLRTTLEKISPEDLIRSIVVVDLTRIRKRPLPI